ncbi:MAG TPA: cytochrome P450 [Acidobacteriaceae bacterium]|jgi:cytochrome P450
MDAFRPEVPSPAAFDPGTQVWTLSRYADVSAALREPALLQASSKFEPIPGEPEARHNELFAAVQADLARMTSPEWRTEMEQSLTALLASHRGQSVELLRDILHPWTAGLMLHLSGAAGETAKELSRLSNALLLGAVPDPHIAALPDAERTRWKEQAKLQQKDDDVALDHLLAERAILSKPMFAGLTQTLTSFLAKAWVALIQNPAQRDLLAMQPEISAAATEELLRYAGTVVLLYRKAAADVRIGEIEIAEGQSVLLRVGSANFDPEKFEQPEQLDLMRRSTGHLGFGAGLHGCVGSFLVRLAGTTVFPMLAAAEVSLLDEEVIWHAQSSLHWPVYVRAQM